MFLEEMDHFVIVYIDDIVLKDGRAAQCGAKRDKKIRGVPSNGHNPNLVASIQR